jgi:hypothetical protein
MLPLTSIWYGFLWDAALGTDHKSILTEIIQRYTCACKVFEVEDLNVA